MNELKLWPFGLGKSQHHKKVVNKVLSLMRFFMRETDLSVCLNFMEFRSIFFSSVVLICCFSSVYVWNNNFNHFSCNKGVSCLDLRNKSTKSMWRSEKQQSRNSFSPFLALVHYLWSSSIHFVGHLRLLYVFAFLSLRCNLKTLHTLHFVRWADVRATVFCVCMLWVSCMRPVEWNLKQVLNFQIFVNHREWHE